MAAGNHQRVEVLHTHRSCADVGLHDRLASLAFEFHACRRSDHALDAVIAALNARAAALGLTATPGAEQLDAARTEGWIALPTGNLADLAENPGPAGRTSP